MEKEKTISEAARSAGKAINDLCKTRSMEFINEEGSYRTIQSRGFSIGVVPVASEVQSAIDAETEELEKCLKAQRDRIEENEIENERLTAALMNCVDYMEEYGAPTEMGSSIQEAREALKSNAGE